MLLNIGVDKIFSRQFPDISMTAVKFADITRFSRQVVTLLNALYINSTIVINNSNFTTY